MIFQTCSCVNGRFCGELCFQGAKWNSIHALVEMVVRLTFGAYTTQHWVWSYGTASQFKAEWPFYFVGKYLYDTSIVMTWSFFGSSHWKGEHDGADIVIKHAPTHERLKVDGVHMNCATHVVKYLGKNMSFSAIGVNSAHVWDMKHIYLGSEVRWSKYKEDMGVPRNLWTTISLVFSWLFYEQSSL